MSEKTITFKIKRQENQETQSYWEEFEIPYRENMNVISGLMEIQRNPVNSKGQKTTPVTWDMNCLEEVCGACSMRSEERRVGNEWGSCGCQPRHRTYAEGR